MKCVTIFNKRAKSCAARERGGPVGKVVTVMNMKGGVGKTTVATHLASAMARYNLGGEAPLRVLAIDYDPQFNMSQALLESKRYFSLEKSHKTTLAVLLDDDSVLDPFSIQVAGGHTPPSVKSLAERVFGTKNSANYLDLVPSTLDLMYVALGQSTVKTKPMEERFAKFITEARASYDIVFIDCHPAGSLFTQTSLMASDHVLIPVMPQRYAVRGIGLMMDFIRSKKLGEKPPRPHIIFNAVPRTGVCSEEKAIRANPRYSSKCLTATMKWYKAFHDPEDGAGFVWQSTAPYSTEAFGNLLACARELRKRVFA